MDGDKGSLSMSASECEREVVSRLEKGNIREDVMVLRGMGSEVVGSDGFGS